MALQVNNVTANRAGRHGNANANTANNAGQGATTAAAAANTTTTTNTTTTATTPAQPQALTWGQTLKGLGVFGLGFGVGLFVFFVSFVLFQFVEANYILKDFLILATTLLLLWAINYAIGQTKSNYKGPVLATVFIAFTILLLLGIKAHAGEGDKNQASTPTVSKESFTFTSNERWCTDAHFSSGKKIKIFVGSSSVNLIDENGNTIELRPENSPYSRTVNSNGVITFDGIPHGKNTRSNVTVEWNE